MSDKKNKLLKRDNMWFVLLLKRQLLRPFSWVIVFFMVLSVASIYYVTAPDADNKKILLFNENSYAAADDYSEKLIQGLLTASDTKDTIFEFVCTTSYEELIEAVTSGSVECGFVLTKEFDEKIVSGDTDGIIAYVESTYTNKGEVAKETVFSEFFEIYGKILIENKQVDIFGTDDAELKKWLDAEYDRLLIGDEVFNADYQTIEGVSMFSEEKKLQSVRGLVMILITMALLLNGSEKFYGSTKNVAGALPFAEKTRFELLMEIAGIVVPAIIGFVLIRVLDPSVEIIADIILFVLFVLFAVIWTFVFGKLINKGISYMAWLLTLLIAQFVLCPVWQDASDYVSSLKYVAYLFPAGAYLRILEIIAG